MTKKQKNGLKILQHIVSERFGEKPIPLNEIIAIAKNDLKFNVARMAALFEVNKDDFRRYYSDGLTPPYFIQGFRRYFNINMEVNHG